MVILPVKWRELQPASVNQVSPELLMNPGSLARLTHAIFTLGPRVWITQRQTERGQTKTKPDDLSA